MSYGASRTSKGMEAFSSSKASAGEDPNLPPQSGLFSLSLMGGSLDERWTGRPYQAASATCGPGRGAKTHDNFAGRPRGFLCSALQSFPTEVVFRKGNLQGLRILGSFRMLVETGRERDVLMERNGLC